MLKTVKSFVAALVCMFSISAQDTVSVAINAPCGDDCTLVQNILNECGLQNVKVTDVATVEYGRVVTLDLSNKDIRQSGISILPASIGSLSDLRELVAKDNAITIIPYEIFQLKNLRVLNLASNSISAIPSGIGELISLEEIDLRYNGIEYLPPEIGSLKKIVKLQLWGNRLTSLEPFIIALPFLKELYLKDNRLTTLPEGIMKKATLSYIDFLGNKICNPSSALDAWLTKKDKQYKSGQKCW